MRAQAFLDASDCLPQAGLTDLLGGGGMVVVAPHPDDESLGCGGLIAAAAACRRAVRVVVLSDGTGSHPNSKAYPPDRLRDLREEEARAAVGELGLDPHYVTFLRLPDRHVPARGPGADGASSIIDRLCHDAHAGALFVTWRHDPHCDHRAAYAITRAAQRRRPATRLFEYVVWGRSSPELEVGGAPFGYRFDVRAQRARKQRAIACHRSQIGDLIDDDAQGFRLSADILTRFDRSDEIFLEADG